MNALKKTDLFEYRWISSRLSASSYKKHRWALEHVIEFPLIRLLPQVTTARLDLSETIKEFEA